MTEVTGLWEKFTKEGKRYFTGKDQFGHRLFLFEVESKNLAAPKFRLCSDLGETSAKEKPRVSTSTVDQSDQDIYA